MKKYSKVVTGVLFSLVTVCALGILFLPSFQQKASASQSASSQYLKGVTQTMSEVQLARSAADVPNAIASVSNFMELRAGLRLSPLVTQQLNTLETATLNGKEPLISFDKFVATLTDVGLDRVSKLTDDEIARSINAVKDGLDAPDMPSQLKNSDRLLQIRPGKLITISKQDAITQLKALASPQTQLVVKGSIRSEVQTEVKNTLSALAKASPDKFGSVWNLREDKPASGLTPMQCLFVTYSLVTGDLLSNNRENLDKQKSGIYQFYSKKYGNYPIPQNYSAYGSNGYLFRSPVDIFFGEKEQLQLLNTLSQSK